MKKTFKVTIEVNTDSPKAEEWEKIDDYVETEIEDALSYVRDRVHQYRNYSIMRSGTSIKVSMRTTKN